MNSASMGSRLGADCDGHVLSNPYGFFAVVRSFVKDGRARSSRFLDEEDARRIPTGEHKDPEMSQLRKCRCFEALEEGKPKGRSPNSFVSVRTWRRTGPTCGGN